MMNKSSETKSIDLAIFWARWLIVFVVFAAELLPLPGLPSVKILNYLPLGVVIGSIIALYNILILILILLASESWPDFTEITIAIDILLIMGIVTWSGPILIWLALVPVVVSGILLGQVQGAAVGAIVVVGASIIEIVKALGWPSGVNLAYLFISTVLLPLIGLTSGLLSNVKTRRAERQAANVMRNRMIRRLGEVDTQLEIIESLIGTFNKVLSEGKPDLVFPQLLHNAAISVERLNDKAKVVGGLVLKTEPGGIHIGEAGYSLDTRDRNVEIPESPTGIVTRAQSELRPITIYEPQGDSQIRYLSTFQNAEAVICVPIISGYTPYGALLLGIVEIKPSTGSPDNQKIVEKSPGADFTNNQIRALVVMANLAVFSLATVDVKTDLDRKKKQIATVNRQAKYQMARQLHDGPVNDVFVIKAEIDEILTQLNRNGSISLNDSLKKLLDVKQHTQTTYDKLRDMLFTLRPKILEDKGLSAAIKELTDKLSETYKQNVEVLIDPEVDSFFSLDAKANIFSFIEEAVKNACKYASAKRIFVKLSIVHDKRIGEDVLVIVVADNGIGFDVEESMKNYSNRDSLGMLNLRERIALLDGAYNIKSARGEGTTVEARIPLESAEADQLVSAYEA
jgi:signal transduction histidine kinase